MKARIYFETKRKDGHIDWEAYMTYSEFVESMAASSVNSNGYGYLIGTENSVRLSTIVSIEKLED